MGWNSYRYYCYYFIVNHLDIAIQVFIITYSIICNGSLLYLFGFYTWFCPKLYYRPPPKAQRDAQSQNAFKFNLIFLVYQNIWIIFHMLKWSDSNRPITLAWLWFTVKPVFLQWPYIILSVSQFITVPHFNLAYSPLGTGDLKFYQFQGLSTLWGLSIFFN